MKSLILYYTRTGETKYVAEILAKEIETDVDIEKVIDTKKRKGALGYISAGKDAMTKKVGDISPIKSNIDDYDRIFIGQPVWGWTMVPAIRGLLDKYKIKNKNVVLFCTMGGSGDEGCFKETRKGLLSCDIIGELAIIKATKNKEKTQTRVREFVSSL
jgi:flavodoxin